MRRGYVPPTQSESQHVRHAGDFPVQLTYQSGEDVELSGSVSRAGAAVADRNIPICPLG